jgi:hypothetical protein
MTKTTKIMKMKNLYPNQSRKLYNKYIDLSNRIRKAIKNGLFYKYSFQKQQQFLKILNGYQRQLQRAGIALGTAVVLTLPAATAQAQQPVANGSQFQVNTVVTTNNVASTAAMDSDGDFAVTWASYDTTSSTDYSIYLQRYDNTGVKQGSEIKVAADAAYYPTSPQVAMDDDGDMVVLWLTSDITTPLSGIYFQRYDNNGAAVGTETKVNDFTVPVGSNSVAMDDDGDFVVVWSGYSLGVGGLNLYMRRYDNNGTALGGETKVNDTSFPLLTDVAMDTDGDFAVVWMTYDYNIYLQQYDNLGAAVGGETEIGSPGNYSVYPSVAMDDDGDFVVVWTDYSNYAVEMQMYHADGSTQGAVTQVSTNAISLDAAVEMDATGNFVVVWNGLTNYSTYGQAYNSVGTTLGSSFSINQGGVSRGLAMDDNGDFVVTWQAEDLMTNDYNIYAQRYTGNLPTAIKNQAVTLSLEIYPNPTTEILYLKTPEKGLAKVYNLLGQTMMEVSVLESSTSIPVEQLPKGNYLLELTNDKGQQATMKFVKQ